MDDKIKDGLIEWYLLFGSRAVIHQEIDAKNQFRNPAFLLDYANGDTEYIKDTTPSAAITDTLWQITPEALEIIKGIQ